MTRAEIPSDPREESPIELRPRFRYQLAEVLLGAPFFGATIAFLLRAVNGIESMSYVVGSGVASTIVFAGLYLLRFQFSAPRAVRVDGEAVRVVRRDREDELSFEHVRHARHRARNGLRWELRTEGGTEAEPALILRDDGFSVKQWERISERIERELRRRGVEVEADAFGRIFRAE